MSEPLLRCGRSLGVGSWCQNSAAAKEGASWLRPWMAVAGVSGDGVGVGLGRTAAFSVAWGCY